ncbi:MAG: hypothetical protein OXO52_02690 [Rhodospirillales bacterium]|nr:hypothetical protein [Rhodospirillales bacterium]MDE0378573.1 hypothetical protein [Rhodospirillales bacterium]
MRSPVFAAALAAAAMLVLASCVRSNTIEGHQVRATAETVTERVEVTGGVHDRAPQWFKDYWRKYLAHAEGGYATIAVDRNGMGASYVYCSGSAGCANNNASWARSFTDVRYKHRALKQCTEYVRNTYPTKKPDCAIYAINNKIVWRGRMPWE